MNDIDYDLLAQMIPVAVLSGRYKIEIKAHRKNKLILGISCLVTAKQTTSMATASAAATAAKATTLTLSATKKQRQTN